MKTNFNGASAKSGVYKIINTINGRVYYGSCARFYTRFSQHNRDLTELKHANRFLQNDFNKCGAEAFEFHVLDVFEDSKDKAGRLAKEQEYLDKQFDSGVNCYNLRKEAVSSHGSKPHDPIEHAARSSRVATTMWNDPVKRQKILEKQKAACSTPEARKACSTTGKLAWKENAARKEKAAYRMKRRWGSTDEAAKTKLIKTTIDSAVSKQKRKETLRAKIANDPVYAEKYRLKGLVSIAKINANIRYKVYGGVVSPEGVVFDFITNLNAFAKQHGLFSSNLKSLLNGKIQSTKGWKRKDDLVITKS